MQSCALCASNQLNAAYIPEMASPWVEPLSFPQRVANTIIYSIADYNVLGWMWWPLFINTSIFDPTGFREMIENMDLLFLGSHFVTQSPQVWAPNTVEVGGLHCRDGDSLPTRLQHLLDNTSQPAVLVSFGSSVSPSQGKTVTSIPSNLNKVYQLQISRSG